MKKIQMGWMVLCCLLTMSACDQSKPQQMTIKVQLVHIPKNIKVAYLDELKPTGAITIDSTKIDRLKGSFTFQMYANPSESLYRIRSSEQHGFLLVAGDQDIQITGDYSQVGKIHITGSKVSVELQHFITGLNKQNTILNKLAQSIHNPPANINDSLLRTQKYKLRQEKLALVDTVLKKARNTNSPVVALFALSILDDNNARKKAKPIFDGLTTRFPKSRLAKEAFNNYKKKLNNQGKSLAIAIGEQAPNITYPDPAGQIISLSDYKGKYVLLDFWASWCAPCRAANPDLVRAYNRFKKDNFSILGVSLDTKKSSWTKAIQQDKLSWKQISDLKGWNSQPAADYDVEAIPANFLINPEGKIIAKNLYGDSLTIQLARFLSGNKE